jgi:hypothetical protein
VLLGLTVERIIHQIAIGQDLSAMNLIVLDLDRPVPFFLIEGRHFGKAMSIKRKVKSAPREKAGEFITGPGGEELMSIIFFFCYASPFPHLAHNPLTYARDTWINLDPIWIHDILPK